MTSTLRDAVADNSRSLTAADRRLVDYLLRNIREAVFQPAAAIAGSVGVHESTVIRLSQKLGFSGYPEMREAMRAEVRDKEPGLARLVKLTDTRGLDLQTLIDAEITALARLADFVSQADLDTVARAVLTAGRVYLFGNYYTEPLMAYLHRRLSILGVQVLPLPHEGPEIAEHVTTMGPGDVLFAFCLRRDPPGLRTLVGHAADVGATSVVLTDMHGLVHDPAPTVLLVAPRGVDEDFRTQVIPHLLCYALTLAMNHLDPVRCEAALSEVDQLKLRFRDA